MTARPNQYGPARSARIELRCSEEQRGAYIETAGGSGLLTEWILTTLDAAVSAARQPKTAAPEKSTRPEKNRPSRG